MPKFVRCMEGHAFDSEKSEACPTCGASVWRGGSDAKPKRTRERTDSSTDEGRQSGSSKWLMAGGGGIAVIAAAVVGYLVLRPAAVPPASPTVSHSQAVPPEPSAPSVVASQTQPPQSPGVTAPQKPESPGVGPTPRPQPPSTGQPTAPATVTQVNPAPPSPPVAAPPGPQAYVNNPPLVPPQTAPPASLGVTTPQNPTSSGVGPTTQPQPPSPPVVAPPGPQAYVNNPPLVPPQAAPIPPANTVPPPSVPQPAPVVVAPPSAVVDAPANFVPRPPVVPTGLSGRAHFAQQSLAILDIDGTPVRLQGVISQGDRERDAAERFLSYITQGTNQVRCEPEGDRTYECRAVRTDVRIGAGVIANGFAAADPAAPAEFQHWEDDARRAHRGIWSAQAKR